MPDAIVIQNLSKRFRRYHHDKPSTFHEALMRGFRKLGPSEYFWSLQDINVRIAPGRMVAVIGRNGAGKSTLLRVISGVMHAERGSVKVRGKLRALHNLGAGFHPDLTGRENALINGIVGGLTRRELLARLDSIIAFSELESFIDSPLRVYSSGMQMRLAFSIAIHAQPDVLLIDEVLAVGDLAFQRKCMERIERLKMSGCTIVIVSHDADIARKMCDETLWLRSGRLAAYGPSEVVTDLYLAEADAPAWSNVEQPDARGCAAERSGEPEQESASLAVAVRR